MAVASWGSGVLMLGPDGLLCRMMALRGLMACRDRDDREGQYIWGGLCGFWCLRVKKSDAGLTGGFARRHKAAFSSVFWLDGRSEGHLRQSLAGYASKIPKGQIPDRSRDAGLNSEKDVNIVVADVLDWFARPDNVSWLLVFDNVDEDFEQGSETSAYDIRRYLPGDHGSVLITTRPLSEPWYL